MFQKPPYLVPGSLVADIFSVAVDIVHGVGLRRDVLLSGAGSGSVDGLIRHCLFFIFSNQFNYFIFSFLVLGFDLLAICAIGVQ